jgi:methylenetetrahydrofolate dehydrogenase (NADP+)/methenyltetrahydrofolate cyclohydrolase
MADYVILDGKSISETIISEVRAEVDKCCESAGRRPGLAVVLVGNDPASRTYVKRKKKACEKAAITSFEYLLPENISQNELVELIREINFNPAVDGILVQLPLPFHIDESVIINTISPEKDADCFHPLNIGRLFLNEQGPRPCTPAGIMELLSRSGIETAGKNVVVLGRSNIVGKPMALMMLEKGFGNATVTICHSATRDIQTRARQADILIAAMGRPRMVGRDWVREGAVVVDVGINLFQPLGEEKARLVGDVDFDQVAPVTSAITPVPGGVGPMTIATLLTNCLHLYRNHVKIDTSMDENVRFQWRFTENLAIVSPPRHFDLYNADIFQSQFEDTTVSKAISGLIIDFSGVDFIDSRALAVLTMVRKNQTSSGIIVKMAAMPDNVRKIFQKTYLHKYFTICSNVEDAINSDWNT